MEENNTEKKFRSASFSCEEWANAKLPKKKKK